VNPREYPKTCERCGLQTICRVEESEIGAESENDPQFEAGDDVDSTEVVDE
jgi:hypothetical protein